MANDSLTSPLKTIDVCSNQDPEEWFNLVQMVGSGTFGKVFKAVHIKSGQFAAIKVININGVNQEDLVSEMKLLKSQSHHRNIAEYYGSFIKRGTPVTGDHLSLSPILSLSPSHSPCHSVALSDVNPFQALMAIVQRDAPTLDPQKWSYNFQSFIKNCLVKDPLRRPNSSQLLQHSFIAQIQKHIRHIRHEITTHRVTLKDQLQLGENSESPLRHQSPNISNDEREQHGDKEEYLKRKQWEICQVESDMKKQYRQMQHQQKCSEILHQDLPEKLMVENQNLRSRPQMIPPHPPNLRLCPAPLVYTNGRGEPLDRSQLQKQRSRSPTSPGQVPYICVSPHDEVQGTELRHQIPDLRNHNILRNYNSWNSDMGHKYRHRSASPCQRAERSNCRDKNENSRRNRQHMVRSQENFMRSGIMDLSASAPERSLRQAMGTRERRLYSTPQGNSLHVPQQLPPSAGQERQEKTLSTSYQDLPSCDSTWELHDLPPKGKPGLMRSLKGLIRNLGLSPSTSPQHSSTSSRSPSPGSSPVSLPFSPPLEQSYSPW